MLLNIGRRKREILDHKGNLIIFAHSFSLRLYGKSRHPFPKKGCLHFFSLTYIPRGYFNKERCSLSHIIIGLLRGSVRGEGIKETDTDCSVSVLVERQINLSNLFIKNFAKVVEFGQKMKMQI